MTLSLMTASTRFHLCDARPRPLETIMQTLKSILSQTIRNCTRTHARRRTPSALAGQALEARRVPTVTATLSAAGALALTGDNTANDISITGNVATGNVTLQGNNGTQITLNGVTAAQHVVDLVHTVNGTFGTAADKVLLNDMILGTITLNMGLGGDTIEMDNLFANGVTLNGGDGDNSININNVRFGATNITTGTGTDKVNVNQAKIVGALTISTGFGGDSVSLDDNGVTNGLRVIGALKIITSDGDDDVDLGSNSTSTFGSITIDAGKGDDEVENISGRVLGAVSVKTGDGNDFIDFDAGAFGTISVDAGSGENGVDFDEISANSLTIVTGDQVDSLSLDETSVVGATSIKMGGGADTLKYLGENHLAALTIDMGNGDNRLEFISEVSVNSLLVTTGTGIDTIFLNVASRGDVTVKSGEGGDDLIMTVAALGKLTLETAGGDDNLEVVDALIVRGAASITTGLGDDFVGLIAGAGFLNQFGSTLNVNTGLEDDNVDLGRTKVLGDTVIFTEDLDVDDSRFKGKFKGTVKGNTGNSSIDVERDTLLAGETIFEKDAELIFAAVSSQAILLGSDNAFSKTTFKAAAKFSGLAADPVQVAIKVLPTVRVFFNGPAPVFTNAFRFDF